MQILQMKRCKCFLKIHTLPSSGFFEGDSFQWILVNCKGFYHNVLDAQLNVFFGVSCWYEDRKHCRKIFTASFSVITTSIMARIFKSTNEGILPYLLHHYLKCYSIIHIRWVKVSYKEQDIFFPSDGNVTLSLVYT